MTSNFLPRQFPDAVNPLGALCFDVKRQAVEFRGSLLHLSDGALRLVWCLLDEPAGVRRENLLEKCWHSGASNNLHKAAWEFRTLVGKTALIQEKGIYRLNPDFFGSQRQDSAQFENLAARLLGNRSLPIGEFLDLLFKSESADLSRFGSETLICARDPLALIRANLDRFAAGLQNRRGYFIATAPQTLDRIPGMMAAFHETFHAALHRKVAVDPLDQLRKSIVIVITDLPRLAFADPIYILDSQNSARCMRFTLAGGNKEAIFIERGDEALEFADLLRSHFLPLQGHGMIRVACGATLDAHAMEKLRAGIVHAFERFGDPGLTAKALGTCFAEPERKQPGSESNTARIARAER